MDYPSLFLASDSIQNVFSGTLYHTKSPISTQSELYCETCKYKTTKQVLMRQHTLVKHSGLVKTCSACDYRHYHAAKVRKHFNQVHLNIKRKNKTQSRMDCFEMDCKNTLKEDCEEMGHNQVNCKHCDYYSFTKRTIRLHIRTNHEEMSDRRTQGIMDCFEMDCKNTNKEECKEMGHNKIICKHCDYTALTKRTMRCHIRIKHKGMILSCNQCDFKCSRKAKLNYHVSVTHDGEVFSCNKCGYISNTKRGLKKHEISNHNVKVYECNKCEYKCAESSSLKKHIRTSHTELSSKQENRIRSGKIDDKIVHCFERNCEKISNDNCIQMEHNKLFCFECEYFSYSKRLLTIHKRRYHDKNLKSEPSLSKHVQFDHKETPLEYQPIAYVLQNDEEEPMQKKDTGTEEDHDEYDSYEEDEEKSVISNQVNDMEGKEEKCDRSVQYFDAEMKISKLKNITKFNCDTCSFVSENQNISKLHCLSHKFSESEILKTIPASLKDLTFNSEEEFIKTLDMFLVSLSTKDAW